MRRIVLALGLVGCVQSSAVPCGDGLVCAPGRACRIIGERHLCVGGEELDACLELPEGGACSVGGVAGSCRDGVCVAAVCGDHVTDPGEACDDGNATIGDGCSLECLSNETCGNGFTDSLRREGTMLVANEQCDDANLGGHDGCSSGCRIEAPVWLPGEHVKAVIGVDAAMVWDAARGRMVLFGGRVTGLDTAGLYEWDGGAWTSRVALSSPPPRSRHAMAYDGQGHRVVVFGGASGTAKLDDTWAWDGTSWRLLGGAMSPSPRDDVRMAYDAKRKKLVLFGGAAAASASGGTMGAGLGDTWELDGDVWTRTCTTCGPPARWGHLMAFDPARGVVVMYGGYDNTGATLSDVWEYDGSWHDRTPVATGGPFGRAYSAMAFDPVRRKLVMTGGTYQNVPLGDAWGWDGTSWTSLPAPNTTLDHHVMGYDVTRGRAVAAVPLPARVYELDATAWRAITMIDPPSGRLDAGIASDLEGGTSILFGGVAGQTSLDETWTFDGDRWVPVAPTVRPTARSGHGMAFDRAAHRAVIYGGQLGGGSLVGESWTFDPTMAKWTQQTSSTPRTSNELAWDGQRVISFGGETAAGRTADTLAWTGTGWMVLAPPQAPPARTDAALAFDPVRQRVVLFGGTIGGGTQPTSTINDTWAWDGSTWSRLSTPIAPPARERATLAWDAGRRRLVLFGGRSGSTAYDDAWELDGSTWAPLALQLRPEPRFGHVAIGAAQGILVFAGGETTKPMDQWRLRWESFSSDEACRADLDLDADGLRGCADPDCWASCQPLCPPGAAASCVTGTPHCGDGTCGAVESCLSCPADCGACPSVCGDFVCDGTESPATCPGDC